MVAFANDRIAFPVINAASCINYGWALFDANAILEDASALLPTGVSLAACLLAAQQLHEFARIALVFVDVLINRFVADRKGSFEPQPVGDLLGRQG